MEMQMEFIRKIPTPQELKERFPLDDNIRKIKAERDEEIAKIFRGEDNRFLLIIGPCSADREDAVLEYMTRLAAVQEKVKDKIFMIPRVYTNKPRTKGVGYKGMLHQPDPEKGEDMLAGIIAIREMHSRVVRETGFTCAEEMLYPENHRYLSDLLSYVAVGARSVEDQQHRIVASGIGIPALQSLATQQADNAHAGVAVEGHAADRCDCRTHCTADAGNDKHLDAGQSHTVDGRLGDAKNTGEERG